jgi:hypothetical protein
VSEAALLPFPARPRNRSIETRRAKRVEKAVRERRIVDLLNHGVSVAEIAGREGVTEKRMRAVVRQILAGRRPEGGADYAALQLGRLNEALLVAMSAMSGTNLRAVECVVRIVRAMDRYAGFAPAERRAVPDVAATETEAQAPLALHVTPHVVMSADEGIQSPHASGWAEKASVQRPVGAVALDPRLRGDGSQEYPSLHKRNEGLDGSYDCPQMAPEASEKTVNTPGENLALEETAPTHLGEEGEASPEGMAEPPIGGLLPPDLFAASAPEERATVRPQMAPQDPESIESAPDNDVRLGSPADENAGTAPCSAACGEAPEAPGLEPADLTYVAPEAFEIAPVITVRAPTETSGVFRLVKMRMVRKGWMACG